MLNVPEKSSLLHQTNGSISERPCLAVSNWINPLTKDFFSRSNKMYSHHYATASLHLYSEKLRAFLCGRSVQLSHFHPIPQNVAEKSFCWHVLSGATTVDYLLAQNLVSSSDGHFAQLPTDRTGNTKISRIDVMGDHSCFTKTLFSVLKAIHEKKFVEYLIWHILSTILDAGHQYYRYSVIKKSALIKTCL